MSAIVAETVSVVQSNIDSIFMLVRKRIKQPKKW